MSDHNHPTSPLLTKPPELSEETKLATSMMFVAANTVGESVMYVEDEPSSSCMYAMGKSEEAPPGVCFFTSNDLSL